jgi:hypothetical protein
MREQFAHCLRKLFTRTAVVACALGLVGCADDGPQIAAPVSTLEAATDLAPSQLTASTVAPPGGVPPCDVDELEFVASAEMIIGIRNAGSVECEVDVSKSPNRDPLMEPGVWLRPGGNAELTVATDDTRCEQPASVARIDLVVNGQPVDAPVMLPPTCGTTLTAIYTAD